MSEALFHPAGDGVYVPEERTRGPWDPGSQHGGAPAALLAHLIEAVEPGPEAMAVTRMTVEFLRPVPIAPLQARTEVVRPGKRVQLVTGELSADGQPVCRALALRIRRAQGVAPEVPAVASVPPDRALGKGWHVPGVERPFFGEDGVELCAIGDAFQGTPASAWIRLRVPVLPGVEPSPLARVVAAADFGNGVSAPLSWDEYLFVNSDLTVYLSRPAEGEWICLESSSSIGAEGAGLSESLLHDDRGPIGRSLQSLYVDRRG